MIIGVTKLPVSPEGKHSVTPYIQCGNIGLGIPDYDELGLFREDATVEALTAENIAGQLFAFFELDTWCIQQHVGGVLSRRLKEHLTTKLQEIKIINLKEEGKSTV